MKKVGAISALLALRNTHDSLVECRICSQRFKNIRALNGHMRVHVGNYNIKNIEGTAAATGDGMNASNLSNEVDAVREDEITLPFAQVPASEFGVKTRYETYTQSDQ